MKKLLFAVPAIILMFFAAGGSKPICTPVEPEEPVCSSAKDCEGLPHVMCLGHWECLNGKCVWNCKESCEDYGGNCKDYCMVTETKLDYFCEKGTICCQPGQCDDGTEVKCKMLPPNCPFGTILAVQNNCYKCVNPETCKEPKVCAGIGGSQCLEGEVCFTEGCYPEAVGYCLEKPFVCPPIYKPLCGCDGVTYENDCVLILANVAKKHEGECEKECKALNPYGYGLCDMLLGVVFDGKKCVYASGCSCEPDCQFFFSSFDECEKVCGIGECSVPNKYKYTSAPAINENLSDFKGAPVYLKGYVKVGSAMCTLMACSEENPCCNLCSASMEIHDGTGSKIELIDGGVGQVGCSGNECNYMENCKPFSPGPDFIIWGIVQVFFNYPYLSVDGWCSKQID